MKKWVIIIVVVILAIGGGAILVRGRGGEKAGDDAPGSTNTAKVERGDISVSVSATGTVEPLVTVEVRSKASGEIMSLYVEEGDTLYFDDMIAEIEKKYTQADVDKADADLRSAKARLVQAQDNIELQKIQTRIQIEQAEKNVTESQTRLDKLKEDFELEKVENLRAIKQAEKDLEIAELRVKQEETAQPESVKRAEASVTQTKSSLDLAKDEYERSKALYEKKFTSKAEVDSVKGKLDSAQAQYDSAVAQLEMVKPSNEEDLKLTRLNVEKSKLALEAAKHRQKQEKSRKRDIEISMSQLDDAKSSLELAIANKIQIKMREKDLEASQASLLRAEVALEEANDRLYDTEVRAPITGTILQKNVEEGQVITSSMSATAAAGTLLFTMANLENVYLKTEVDEVDIGKIEPGMMVTIEVEAYPDERFRGNVLQIAPQGRSAQNVTTFEVTTEISNPSNILKPGMNVSINIMAADRRDVLVLANEAIMAGPMGSMVMPLVDGEPAERPQPIETGARGWDKTEIISGLEEGAEVMIMGARGAEGGIPSWLRDRMKNPMTQMRRMQGGGPGGRRGGGGRGPR
ncbi:efflux RND transporter periplasmic adaptor subunit [Candidatus Poribacteria bacterium]